MHVPCWSSTSLKNKTALRTRALGVIRLSVWGLFEGVKVKKRLCHRIHCSIESAWEVIKFCFQIVFCQCCLSAMSVEPLFGALNPRMRATSRQRMGHSTPWWWACWHGHQHKREYSLESLLLQSMIKAEWCGGSQNELPLGLPHPASVDLFIWGPTRESLPSFMLRFGCYLRQLIVTKEVLNWIVQSHLTMFASLKQILCPCQIWLRLP